MKHELREKDGILIVEPESSLHATDFDALSETADPYIKEHGHLNGLVIHTETFPGWDNFAALVSHITFVKEHHRSIRKVAIVSEDGVLSVMPRIADFFVVADLKHFDYDDLDDAIKWIRGE